MNTRETYMSQALGEAYKAAEEDEVPVGAVIVYENRIIARAHNQIKTLKDPTAHAEMIAITQAASTLGNERLNGCDLYVTIEPCAMCVGAAVLARLRSVVYGASDPKKGQPNHTLEVVPGIMETECRAVIQGFFLKKR